MSSEIDHLRQELLQERNLRIARENDVKLLRAKLYSTSEGEDYEQREKLLPDERDQHDAIQELARLRMFLNESQASLANLVGTSSPVSEAIQTIVCYWQREKDLLATRYNGDISTWQEKVGEECHRRWANTIEMEGLAFAEEFAEVLSKVCRSILKRKEGTRGTEDGWTEKLGLEVGQAFFVLLNICYMEEFEAGETMERAWDNLVKKPESDPWDLYTQSIDSAQGRLIDTLAEPNIAAGEDYPDAAFVTVSDLRKLEKRQFREEEAAQRENPLDWVTQVRTVDAIDPVVAAMDANTGWKLIAIGLGSGGQTTLTYGWPWKEPNDTQA